MTDLELLQQYSRAGSDEAFAELMNRHIHWVYSVCRRHVRDTALVEDVTQAVFLTLSRKAWTFSEKASISGWLFITTRYAAMSALKIEDRRQRHERQAATMKHEATQPNTGDSREEALDAALATLRAADREAVILRYFRGLNSKSMADLLGISEEAAKKRVGRALDRLRKKLGPTATAFADAAMTAVLSQRAAQTAPPELAARSLIAVKAGPSPGAQAIMRGMKAMKNAFAVKIAAMVVVAALLAGLATVLAVQTRASEPVVNLGHYDLSPLQVFRVSGRHL